MSNPPRGEGHGDLTQAGTMSSAGDTGPGDPDELLDPRVRELLHRYADLAGATFLPTARDCYELAIPREDRRIFGGRAVVRVALSLSALEVDADAEMAIVGSAFVEQLIAAVRTRGTRRVGGALPPSLEQGPFSTAPRPCPQRWSLGTKLVGLWPALLFGQERPCLSISSKAAFSI